MALAYLDGIMLADYHGRIALLSYATMRGVKCFGDGREEVHPYDDTLCSLVIKENFTLKAGIGLLDLIH